MAQISYFLGANTPQGFYTSADRLLDPAELDGVYILKGGAGCGKSSLMKKVAQAAEDRGERVERLWCSGDPDSLDGVLLPDRKTALVDGTAPHVAEPGLPGAVERYVNLGRFYDSKALSLHKTELMELNKAYKGCYRRAYRCLKGAGQLLEDNLDLLETEALQERLRKRAQGIAAREIPKNGPGSRVEEKFLNAVSCKGRVCFFETVDTLCKHTFELADSYGLANVMLEELLAACGERGWPAVVCPDPMAPQRILHLLIPDLKLAFVTGSPETPWLGKSQRRLRVDAMVPKETLRDHRARLRFARKVAAALTEEGMEILAEAKALHDQLEGVYNPHVDFDGVYAEADRLIAEIFGG